MGTVQSKPPVEAPSKSALAKATGISLLVALLLLFTVVLPAEYGFDPLKTGAALKLTGISQTEEVKKGAAPTPAPGKTGVYRSEPKIYKVESEDFTLNPGEGMEMKYHMQKGAEMVYGWKSNGKLAYEFHGEPDQKPNKDYFESYELNDKIGADSSYGSFTAPTTGIHGWFWQNKSRKDIQFHLTVAGYFDSAKMMAGGPAEEMTVDDAK
ncbi:MAG TPA: hypothetical protein VG297_21955 [Bryobacteraceae bacterium]|jgi:hypothetical protein|nr:hypothetical protein [Bryobacteraceae bacterium]